MPTSANTPEEITPMDGLAVATGQAGLPVLGGDPCERADAKRNREKILAAAETLFAERGTEAVSMDAVAEAAGVGKGTLYRRFGDRSGLARAILDERDREFQEKFIRGEPPLGPGAPPVERLVAFGEGVIDLIADYGDLIMAAQLGKAGARFAGPVYATYRMHVHGLLRDIDPRIDADYFADIVLASLNAEMYGFWKSDVGLDKTRISSGFRQLVTSIAGTAA
ncbi:MAG: TetR/AcrR family transcriptional regulator [Thermoleophilaceae bacterium]|nr:TetR/AcrR family transcriptional regulator [Thermoleophilaceae bacterium]